MRFGALVLTGGASSRMGADKAALDWLGVRAVDRVMAIAEALGAAPIYGVGARSYGRAHVVEEPAFSGPVGGILAGAAALQFQGCWRAVILAVDAPSLLPEDVRPLLAVGGAGAIYTGFPLPMVLTLAALSAEARAGWPLTRLAETAGLTRLDCPPDARARIRGANTPSERDALLQSLRDPGQSL